MQVNTIFNGGVDKSLNQKTPLSSLQGIGAFQRITFAKSQSVLFIVYHLSNQY